MKYFDDVYMHSIRGIVPLSIKRPSFEASTKSHTDEEYKACSTSASLPHKPSIDEQEENRRTEEIKREKMEEWGGGGGFDRGLRGGKCGATYAPCHPASPGSQ